MMVRLIKPHSDLITHLLDVLNSVMLMVELNQNFQWRHHTPAEEVSGEKLNARNYLVKQLVKNLYMGTQRLAEPYSDPCVVHVDSSTH